MNNIVIYGPGCTKCTALAEVTKQVMQELNMKVSLEKVTDAAQFAVAGILVTPAMAVDGKILVSGRVPSKDEIRKILLDAVQEDPSSQKSCGCTGSAKQDTVSKDTIKPEEGSCCGGGGCCGESVSKGGSGWKKAVTWVVILLILLAVVKAINHQRNEGSIEPATMAVPMKSGVEAVYYGYGARCPTCIRMETWAKDTIEKNFPGQIKEEKLVFHSIPADMEAVEKYELTTKSLILKEWKDGKEIRWQNLNRIWDLSGDEQEFKDYVVQNIREKLDEVE